MPAGAGGEPGRPSSVTGTPRSRAARWSLNALGEQVAGEVEDLGFRRRVATGRGLGRLVFSGSTQKMPSLLTGASDCTPTALAQLSI